MADKTLKFGISPEMDSSAAAKLATELSTAIATQLESALTGVFNKILEKNKEILLVGRYDTTAHRIPEGVSSEAFGRAGSQASEAARGAVPGQFAGGAGGGMGQAGGPAPGQTGVGNVFGIDRSSRAYGPYSPEYETRNVAMLYKKAYSAGMDLYGQMSPEQRDQFKKTSETIQKDIESTTTEAVKLQKSYTDQIAQSEKKIKEFTEQIGKSTEAEKKDIESKRALEESKKQSLQEAARRAPEEAMAKIKELSIAKEAVDAPARIAAEQAAQSRAARIQTGLGIAGTALAGVQLANELPYSMAERRAATSALERGSERALQSGDINRYMAIQELGGNEALAERSRTASYLQAFGKIGMGTLGAVGGAALGFTGVGAAVGLTGLGVAMSGVQDVMNTERGALSFREREIEARLGMTKEYRDATSMARATARRSFDIATIMGDRSLEMPIYGGVNQKDIEAQTAAEARRVKETDIYRQAKQDLESGRPGGRLARGIVERADMEVKEIMERGERRKEEARPYQAETGESLATYAAKKGIDYSTLFPVVGALGAERVKRTEGGYAPMQEAINLASLGVGAETQARLLETQGGQADPRQAFSLIKDMYVEAFANGIEKSQLPKAMQSFAQSAANIGYGGAEVVREQSKRATELAGKTFGEGYNVEQLNLATKVDRFLSGGGGPVGSGGFGEAMSIGATSKILQETKVGKKSISEMLGKNAGIAGMFLSQEGQTDESVKEILKTFGMKEEDIETAMKAMGGAKGLTEKRELGSKEQRSKIDPTGLKIAAAVETGARGGQQISAVLKGVGKALGEETQEPGEMLTPEEKRDFEKARRRIEGAADVGMGAAPTGSPGEKAAQADLGVKSQELSVAFQSLKEDLPSFARTVKIVNDAINKALEESKSRPTGFWGMFGNQGR